MNIIREGKVRSWGYGRGARMDERLSTASDYHLVHPIPDCGGEGMSNKAWAITHTLLSFFMLLHTAVNAPKALAEP